MLDLRTALSLYSLTDSYLFWELQRDTRCLLGWNDSTIIVAFRGTASMTNALSDIQVLPPPCYFAYFTCVLFFCSFCKAARTFLWTGLPSSVCLTVR